MQSRYEAGDKSQYDRLVAVAGRSDFPYATRKSAVRALGEIGEPRALPTLLAVLNEFDQRTTLKEEALTALGLIGDPDAVPAIGRLLDRSLNSTSDELRMAAMPVLGSLGGSEAATILVNALTYYDFAMLSRERSVPRGVFSGDEQSLRALQDSMRIPAGVASGGELGMFPGQQMPTTGFFGDVGGNQVNQPVDTMPIERSMAHESLVRVGAPALPVIEDHISRRETTVRLRNELIQIMNEIRGDAEENDSPPG